MTTFSLAWRPQSATILAYAVAILSVTAALVVGLLLDGFLHTMASVSLFLCAIMFAAWFGGLGPSVLATVAALVSFTYFFVDSDSLRIASSDIPRIVLFGATAIFVVSLSATQRRNEESLRQARDQLLARSRSRPASTRRCGPRTPSAGASKPISTRRNGSAVPVLSAGSSPPATSSGRRKAAG
jgi:K+-sensing histidine kinase KdpD